MKKNALSPCFAKVVRTLRSTTKITSNAKQLLRLRSASSGLVVLMALLFLGHPKRLLAQNPLAPAGQFNVFLAKDAILTTNESDGAVAIGGNLTVAGNYQVANKSGASTFKVNNYPIGLVVGGGVKLQNGTLQVNSNTYVKIGVCAGNASTDALKIWYQDNNGAYSTMRVTKATANYSDTPAILINQNANASTETNSPICQGNVIDFADSFSKLKTNSSALAQKATRVKLTDANGNTITGTNPPSQVKIGLYTGINVWNVTGTDLNQIQNLTYSDAPASGQILVINVNAMGSFDWTTPNTAGIGGSNAPYILWNFYNTTQLTIKGNATIEGSLLAPLADVVKTENQANIQGQLVANSFVQSGGEMHDYPFDANPNLFFPDLVPIIYARPNNVYGLTSMTVVVDVLDLKDVPTNGPIIVRVTKDPLFSLSFDGNASLIDGRLVMNNVWQYDDSDPAYYILTTDQTIAAYGTLSFGMTGSLDPSGTSGNVTVSSVIEGGSGGEVKTTNNTDADKIDYFQQ